jgi:hypothetical protein
VTVSARSFAREIGIDPGDRTALKMIECGLHSGISRCCIAFFVKTWWPLAVSIDQLPRRERAAARRAYDAYLRRTAGAEYVPCPSCVSARWFVEVLPCDCEAKRQRRVRRRR